jgi:magnesium chelatase family protein
LLDRIDLQVEVPRIAFEELQGIRGEASASVRERVVAARDRQRARAGEVNARLDLRAVEAHCGLRVEDHALLGQVMERFRLSARSYHRILKVARTIADLDGAEAIGRHHLTEALGYRSLERPPGP